MVPDVSEQPALQRSGTPCRSGSEETTPAADLTGDRIDLGSHLRSGYVNGVGSVSK